MNTRQSVMRSLVLDAMKQVWRVGESLVPADFPSGYEYHCAEAKLEQAHRILSELSEQIAAETAASAW